MNGEEDNNSNNWRNWRVKVDVFRGFVRAKIEGIEATIKTHCDTDVENKKEHTKELKDIKKDIGKIKEYMAAREAVKKLKSGLWGFLGGLVTFALYILSKLLLGD